MAEPKHPLHSKTQAEMVAEHEKVLRGADNIMANLQKKIESMGKYLDTLGTENADLKERIAKLENLHKDELL